MSEYTYEPIGMSFTSETFVRAYLGQELEAAEAALLAEWEWAQEDGRRRRRGLGREELEKIDGRYRAILESLRDSSGLLRRWLKEQRAELM